MIPATIDKSLKSTPPIGQGTLILSTLAGILLFAFAARIFGLGFGFPLFLHPDEWSQVDLAHRILVTADWNPHFFRYGSLFIYQMVVIEAAAAIMSPLFQHPLVGADHYLLGRMLSALYGTLTVWVAFELGRVILNEWCGLGAALLTAISPGHVRQSHYATVDIMMVFWTLLALLLILRATKENGSVMPAGVALGLALATKYPAVLVVPPLLGIIIWRITRDSSHATNLVSERRIALGLFGGGLALALVLYLFPTDALALLRSWTTDGVIKSEYQSLFDTSLLLCRVAAFTLILLGLGAWFSIRLQRLARALLHQQIWLFLGTICVVFLITSPFVLIDLPTAARDIFYEYRHALLGSAAQYAPGDPVLATFATPGLVPEPSYYWDWWIDQNGWIVLAVVIIGGIVLAKKNQVAFWLTALIVFLLALMTAQSANKAERYVLLLAPLLALWSGIGMWGLGMWLVQKRHAWVIAFLIAVVVAFPGSTLKNILYNEFWMPDTRLRAFEWLQRTAPLDTAIVSEYYTLDLNGVSSPIRSSLVPSAFLEKSLDDWLREDVKYILVGRMRAWYQDHAELYPSVVAGYRDLEKRARLVEAFDASKGGAGPTIWVYMLP